MTRERITFSLLSEDQDIIEHLHAIKLECSISSYIRNLIRQDMLGKPSSNNLDQLADKIASKLSNGNLPLSSLPENSNELTASLEDKSIIDSLF